MRIGIVFPVINCLDFTRAAIESIETVHEAFVALVDNGSVDGTEAWFMDKVFGPRGQYIRNDGNAGLTVAWNQGVRACRAAGCEYILIANNDILFHPRTIDNLVQGLEEHPDWGLLSAVNDRGWADEHGGPRMISDKPIPEEGSVRPHPDFSCFMVRASLFDQLAELEKDGKEPNPGWFDEEFSRRGRAFWEDNDFHYRLHRAGIPAYCTDRAPYYHYASVTANATGITSGINRDYFIQKWGGPADVVFPH